MLTEYIREEITLFVIAFIEGIDLEDHNECKTPEMFLEEKYSKEWDFHRALGIKIIFYMLCSYQQMCTIMTPARYSYACDTFIYL